MIGTRLLRFACRAALPGVALIALMLAAGCSGDGAASVTPPHPAAGATNGQAAGDPARHAEGTPATAGLPRHLVPAPAPRGPAFTPHWYTPSVDPLFRRRPQQPPEHTARLNARRVLPFEPETAEPDPDASSDEPAQELKDFHVIAPLLDGEASWYGPGFHGKPTASGEVYDQHRMTAAHPSLPMGTVIRVENQANGRVVWVRVNDRGPYAKGRVLDLSRAAAERLGMVGPGTAPVRIAVLRWPSTTDQDLGLRAYTQYVVQIAAYDEPEKVESLLVEMQERFDWAPFTVDPRPNGMLSVISGPYDDRDEALQTARRFKSAGVTSLVRRYRK